MDKELHENHSNSIWVFSISCATILRLINESPRTLAKGLPEVTIQSRWLYANCPYIFYHSASTGSSIPLPRAAAISLARTRV